MTFEEEFEKARENEYFRAKFIRMVDIKPYSKYVKSVKYNPVQFYDSYGSREKFPSGITTMPPWRLNFLMSGGKSKIEVYPQAFFFKNVDDFLSTLIDHEILGHAKRYFEGNSLRGKEELFVTTQHLALLERRNCSEEYVNAVRENLKILQNRFG
jgi:hypothetical protein